MAEEDLVFGKNRHFFGGIQPSVMRSFNAASNYQVSTSTARIKLTGKLPADTIIDGQTLCTVAGAVIRRSTDAYPETEFDGEQIADIKANMALSDPYSFEITDEDVEIDTAYYYSAFPYTDQGVYCRNRMNRTFAKALTYEYFYGYDLELNDTNPATRVTYPADVDNAGFAPAAMVLTSGGKFNYGSWNMDPGEKFMPRPCMITYSGEVTEYLDPDDYTKTVSGAASQVANTNYGGNAMMEWPKIYTKRWEENGVYHFRCSDIPIDEDYDCWSNYDKNNNEIPHFYTPIYFGSNVSGKMRSISGQSNYVNNTRNSEMNLARANGDGWTTEVLADRLLIQDLLVLMAKSTDTQGKYGSGRSASGNTSAIGQGTMNTKGMFWGSNDQTSGVKVFGMENWWGNLWRGLAGWINANGTQKVKLTQGTHDGTTVGDYNFDGTGYLTVEGATPVGTSGGYISEMKTKPYGRIPFQASGSATTEECDGLWFNNGQVDYAIVGGSWCHALLAGAFCALLAAAVSHTRPGIGAALSYKPLAA